MRHKCSGAIALLLLLSGSTISWASGAHFVETFDDAASFEARWQHSDNEKYGGRFKLAQAKTWTNNGLQIPEASKHYGLTALLPAPVDPAAGVVVQYEVRTAAGHTCGGAYLKLLTHEPGFQPEELHDKTPYTIMFGPDKCGHTGKVHVILRHLNPKSGAIEERHLLAPKPVEFPQDSHTHVYTLRLQPDNSFEVLVDGEVKASGDLLASDAFQPPFQPPTMVPDPAETKPQDWVDEEFIPDPEAVKPADWDDRVEIPDPNAKKPKGWLDDEPLYIPDPAGAKPADWDDEEDGIWLPADVPNPKCKVGCGHWAPPMIRNPSYKGPWKAPTIQNPAWKGVWKAREVPNPDWWEDKQPLAHIGQLGAVAIEVWTIDQDYFFDNIVVAGDDTVPAQMRAQWQARHGAEVAAQKAATDKKGSEKAAKDVKKAKKEPLKGIPKVVVDALKQHEATKKLTKPLVKLIRAQPWVAYILVMIPPLLLLWPLIPLLWPKKKRTAATGAGYDKKHDITRPDEASAKDNEEDDSSPPDLVDNDAAAAGQQGPAASEPAAMAAAAPAAALAQAAGVGAVAVAERAGPGPQGGSKGGSSDEFEMVEHAVGASTPAVQINSEIAPDVPDEEEEEEEDEPNGAKPGPRRRAKRL